MCIKLICGTETIIKLQRENAELLRTRFTRDQPQYFRRVMCYKPKPLQTQTILVLCAISLLYANHAAPQMYTRCVIFNSLIIPPHVYQLHSFIYMLYKTTVSTRHTLVKIWPTDRAEDNIKRQIKQILNHKQ